MSNYKDRLKKLNSGYKGTPASRPKGFVELDKGTYQLVVDKIKFIPESKAPFAKGELEIKVQCKVLTGKFKGAFAAMGFFLEQPQKVINGNTIPSGLSSFKGVLEAMNITMEDLSENSLTKALKEMKGVKFKGYCKGGGNNVYFNEMLEVEDVEITEDDLEGDLDNNSEDTETEPEPKPEPKPQGKSPGKVPSKPQNRVKVEEPSEDTPEDSDDDSDDSSASGDDDDDLDLDEIDV